MFKKSSVELEQSTLRQAESTLDRLSARKLEIETSIAATRQKIIDIDTKLQEYIHGEVTLSEMESASRKAVNEKARQSEWLVNQEGVLQSIEIELANAKIKIPGIEESILRANYAECQGAATVANDAIWKAVRSKIAECIVAHEQLAAAQNRLAVVNGRLQRTMPDFQAIWEMVGKQFHERLVSEGLEAEVKKLATSSKIITEVPSHRLTPDERHVLGDIRLRGGLDGARFLAELKAREERLKPPQVSREDVQGYIKHWSGRIEECEAALATLEGNSTSAKYAGKGEFVQGPLFGEAKNRHEANLASTRRALDEARTNLGRWETRLVEQSVKAA